MQTSTKSRRLIGLLVVVSLLPVDGCRSYQRPSTLPAPGSRARVEASAPFAIVPGTGGESGCQATSAEGLVSEVSSEAIAFSHISDIDAVEWVGSACSRVSAGTVALREGAEVKVRRFSLTRTAVLLGSIVGLVALSIGQASVGY